MMLAWFALLTCFAFSDHPGRSFSMRLVDPPLTHDCVCPGRDVTRGKLTQCFVQVIGDTPRCVAVYEHGSVATP